MAKVTTPLLSETAAGSVTPYLTFSRRKTGQQVRFQKRQKDFLTPGRESQRAAYREVVALWRALDTEEKQTWNESAAGKNYTGYNLFVKTNIGGTETSSYGLRFYGVFLYGA